MKKFALTLALTLSAGSLAAAQVLEAIVIRVGDRIVTRTQYIKRLHDAYLEAEQGVPANVAEARKAEVRKNLPNELISELLIKDRADRLGLTVGEAEIREAVGRLKQQYGITTDQQFEESLRKSGMTRGDMEARLRDTLITNKVFARELRNRDDLTDKELRERYDREKERFRLPERAHLREIIIPKPSDTAGIEKAKLRADEIAAQARLSADFAKLAASIPESPTKDKGGDMGNVVRGELLPELEKAVFNSPAGAIVGPIDAKAGLHIIRIESRLPSEVPAFESVKEKLKKDASEDAFQRDYKAYIERLRKDAFIQINDQNVPSV